jgi:zinc transport system substrate-binding protein
MFCILIGVALAAGCRRTAETPADARLPVFAGIPPIAYLVEQIGGEHVKVDVLVQPGQDPHTFEPTPQQVAALSRAKVFFKIDMPFESSLLEKIRDGNARLAVVDVAQGVKKRRLDSPCCIKDDAHAHDHADDTESLDPHVWLSPALLNIQAGNIAEGLCQADPTHKKAYEKNLAGLQQRLDLLDRRTRQILSPYRGRSFYVFHPGFGYFADAYGLKEEVIEVGGQEPTSKRLHALGRKAKAEGVKTIFVQPQYDPETVRGIAESLGGRAVVIDGLAKNVIADMEDIATKIQAAMQESRGK